MNADDLESAGRAVLVDGRPDDDPSADLDAEEPAGYWRIFLIGLAVILAEIAFFWVFRSRLRPGAFTTLPPALVAFLLLVVTSARRQIRGAVRRTRFRAATRLGERGDARAGKAR